ncbi:MAG: RNA polymerase sigma-70 factor [Chitinophagaceae bacterium]|nr:RNA polymerase sigma-70 factor [Chitinophagaceae bacterium]
MKSFQPYNDQELLKALRAGDESAFTQLYRQYSPRIYYNILSLVKDELTAEELVQDIFTKVWRKRESIHIEKTIAAYLFTVSRNRVYDFFQEVKRDRELYARIRAAAAEHYSYIEEILFARENEALLQKAIASLPPQRRRAFELCKMEGMTYREASEEMGVSLSTLKDHMSNALIAIKQYVSKNREVALSLLVAFLFDA